MLAAPAASAIASAAVKAALYLGVVLLLGSEAFRRLTGPELDAPPARRALRGAALAGGALVLVPSALDLVLTLRGVLGSVDAALVREYLLASLHGRATLARAALALVLVALAFVRRGPGPNALLLAAGVALLGTFSLVSHNAAMPGRLPVLADLAHLAAMTAWAGALLGIAFLPGAWDPDGPLPVVMGRVSATGLAAVGVLLLTGVYSAALHVGEPTSLATTRYGGLLLAKAALVLAMVGIAALNRWRFVPALRRSGPSRAFARAVRAEAVLLLLVLALTGALTTSPVPH